MTPSIIWYPSGMYNREQQKSKLEKHGEGKSHEKAKTRLVNILIDAGWEVHPDCAFAAYSSLDSHYKTTFQETEYYHEFDIYAKKEYSKGKYGLTSELIIEIDGSAHDSKVQQGKDKTAEEYAAFFLPSAKFRRIPIGELFGKDSSIDEQILVHYIIK